MARPLYTGHLPFFSVEGAEEDKKMFEREHYAWIVAILLAGDIQARFITNTESPGVVVSLVTGEQIIWSNVNKYDRWAYSLVRADGNVETNVTILPASATPEEVAKHIATFDYPAPVAFPGAST